MRPGALFFACLVVGACSAGAPPRAQPRAARTEAAPSSRSDSLDPRLEAKLAELDRLHDWRSTVFGARYPNPRIPAHARPIPKRGPFRIATVTTIRAYHYRRGYTNAGAPEAYDSFDPPFTSDGRLDGHVVPPEALLTDEERDRVIAIVHEAERTRAAEGTKRPVLRCMFDPHHVFVLFDATEAPIAKFIVCFTCGELAFLPSLPAFGGDGTAVMTENETQTFKRIADDHGLGAWTYGDSPEREELLAYETQTRGVRPKLTALGRERLARANDRPSGAPAAVTPRRSAHEDRHRFCVWLQAEISSRSHQREFPVSGSFECKEGVTYTFANRDVVANDCETEPLCDAPFGQIEACLRASFLKGPEELCGRGPAPTCDGLLPCLPYVSWRGRGTRIEPRR